MRDLSNENVVFVNHNGLQYIQFRRLLEYKDRIVHAYTIGLDKNYRFLSQEDNTQIKGNYKNLCDEIGADYNKLVCSNQSHTDRVESVEQVKNFMQEKIKVDALCTNIKGITLSTINADCILLLFYDPVKNVIANAHSGWRGTLQRISVKTVQKMQTDFGCDPKDIICCISPSIRKCHFEVDQDVRDLYKNEFVDLSNLNDIIEEKIQNKKWHIDTVKINRKILENAGLDRQNIIDSGICTVCNKDLIHSYRAQKQGYGVETLLIGLK